MNTDNTDNTVPAWAKRAAEELARTYGGLHEWPATTIQGVAAIITRHAPTPDAVASALREAIRNVIYFRNERVSGGAQGDRPPHPFEIQEADEILEAVLPLLATPTTTDATAGALREEVGRAVYAIDFKEYGWVAEWGELTEHSRQRYMAYAAAALAAMKGTT